MVPQHTASAYQPEAQARLRVRPGWLALTGHRYAGSSAYRLEAWRGRQHARFQLSLARATRALGWYEMNGELRTQAVSLPRRAVFVVARAGRKTHLPGGRGF